MSLSIPFPFRVAAVRHLILKMEKEFVVEKIETCSTFQWAGQPPKFSLPVE